MWAFIYLVYIYKCFPYYKPFLPESCEKRSTTNTMMQGYLLYFFNLFKWLTPKWCLCKFWQIPLLMGKVSRHLFKAFTLKRCCDTSHHVAIFNLQCNMYVFSRVCFFFTNHPQSFGMCGWILQTTVFLRKHPICLSTQGYTGINSNYEMCIILCNTNNILCNTKSEAAGTYK